MYGEESLSNFWRVTASYLQQQREGLVISRAVSQHNNHRRRQKRAAAHKTRGICRSWLQTILCAGDVVSFENWLNS